MTFYVTNLIVSMQHEKIKISYNTEKQLSIHDFLITVTNSLLFAGKPYFCCFSIVKIHQSYNDIME